MASPRSEDGFTLVELMAACLLLAVGILGVVAVTDQSRTIVSRGELRETMTHRAQREIERVRSLPYAQLGLVAAPSASSDPQHPNFYVRSGNRYQWDSRNAANVGDLVLGGTVNTQSTWADGRHSGNLHVFITTHADAAVAGPVQARRITVAITANGPWSPPRPLTVSTLVHDPVSNPS